MSTTSNSDYRQNTRHDLLDRLIIGLDNGLRTVFGTPQGSGRPDPGKTAPDNELDEADRRISEGLMRVDHAGEVSAQALYQGQSLVARDPQVRLRLLQSAEEENDHLCWCEQRIEELGGHRSYLSPLWYLGSFTTGLAAGLAGDKWSLGFVVETELQVIRHLDDHIERLPVEDEKSRAILEKMKQDEAHHATVANEAGATELPPPVKRLMTLQSRVMTTLAYWF